MEAAASGGRLPPAIAAKLDVFEEAGVLIPGTREAMPDVQTEFQAYRAAVRAARQKV